MKYITILILLSLLGCKESKDEVIELVDVDKSDSSIFITLTSEDDEELMVSVEIYTQEELNDTSPLPRKRTSLDEGEYISVVSDDDVFILQKHLTDIRGSRYIHLFDIRYIHKQFTFNFHDLNGDSHILGSTTMPVDFLSIEPTPVVTQSVGPNEEMEITWNSFPEPDLYDVKYSYFCFDDLDFSNLGFLNKGEGNYSFGSDNRIIFSSSDISVLDVENHPNYICNATVEIKAVNELIVSNLFSDGSIRAIQQRNVNFVVTNK